MVNGLHEFSQAMDQPGQGCSVHEDSAGFEPLMLAIERKVTPELVDDEAG